MRRVETAQATRGGGADGHICTGAQAALKSSSSFLHEVLILAVKGLAGGSLVTAFALLAEGLKPKRFAGLFGAAPAVALAGMIVVLLDKGSHAVHENAVGMIAGGVGMVAYAAAVTQLLKRADARPAIAIALVAWAALAAIVALPLLLG